MNRLNSRERSRGQTLAEFALIIPIFFLMLVILFDLGRVVYAQNAINNDAREGTRVGAVSKFELTDEASYDVRYQAIRDAARRMSPGVEVTDDAIEVVYTDTGTLRVTITISIDLLTPFISDVFGGAFELSATSETAVRS